MSARTSISPKTAALEALVEAHAAELKLPTVNARFRTMAAEATREQQTPVAYLAALLEAEVHERQERRDTDGSSTPGSRRSSAWRSSASPITRRSRRQRSPR